MNNNENMNGKNGMILENNVLIKYLLVFMLFILNIFSLYSLTNYLAATATNKFFNILINIGPILSFIGCLMFVWILFYNFFFKESKKVTFYSLMGSCCFLFVLSFVFFMINYSYLESCFSQGNPCSDRYFLFGFFLTVIMLAVFLITSIYHVIKKEHLLKTLRIYYTYKLKPRLYTPYLLGTFFASYLFYALFVLTSGAVSSTYPLATIFLFSVIITIIINWIYFLCYFVDKKKTSSFMILGLNSLILILFIIYEILEPGFLIHVLKPIAPIDFAASIPVMYYLFLISIVVTIVFSLLKVIKKNKPIKEVEQEK